VNKYESAFPIDVPTMSVGEVYICLLSLSTPLFSFPFAVIDQSNKAGGITAISDLFPPPFFARRRFLPSWHTGQE